MEEFIDQGLSHVTPPGKTAYTAETHVGNWYEDNVQNALKRQEFIMKRECEELSIQKSQKMVDILLKPVELTARTDGYLHFGDSVQIISAGPDCKTAIEKYPFKRNYCTQGHLALSSAVPPSVVDHAPYLNTDSIISVSPHLFPVVRNSYVIERPDCPADVESVVNYGDVFRVRAMPTQHFPLYLFSSPGIRLHCLAIHSGKTNVRFSDLKTSDTLWRAVPLDPLLQIKMEFEIPVPLKTRMMIKHACSGNNLSTESDFPVLTYFGEELEVTLDTKLDRVNRPTFANHWYFDTERGWAKPEKEMQEQAKYSAAINVNDNQQSRKQTTEEEDDDEEELKEDNSANQQRAEVNYQQQIQDQIAAVTVDSGPETPYDPRTSPQPNAHSYRISDYQEFYPNKKWNCGDTDCCNLRPPATPPVASCAKKPTDCYK